MINALFWWFSISWKAQKWLMEKSINGSKAYTIASFTCIGSCALVFVLGLTLPENLLSIIVVVGLFMVSYISFIVWRANDILCSARGLFEYGLLFSLVVPVMLFFIYYFLSPTITNEMDAITEFTVTYIILCVCFTAPWVALCNLANAKVSTLVNITLAFCTTIVLHILNGIFDAMPSTTLFLKSEFQTYMMNSMGITAPQMYKTSAMIILTPFVLMQAVSTLQGAAKTYWIEKYNNGNDLQLGRRNDSFLQVERKRKLKNPQFERQKFCNNPQRPISNDENTTYYIFNIKEFFQKEKNQIILSISCIITATLLFILSVYNNNAGYYNTMSSIFYFLGLFSIPGNLNQRFYRTTKFWVGAAWYFLSAIGLVKMLLNYDRGVEPSFIVLLCFTILVTSFVFMNIWLLISIQSKIKVALFKDSNVKNKKTQGILSTVIAVIPLITCILSLLTSILNFLHKIN